MSHGDNDFVDAPRRMICPECGRNVSVEDPYRGAVPKRGSAWFCEHKDRSGIRCVRSLMTAFVRTPRPLSEEGGDAVA